MFSKIPSWLRVTAAILVLCGGGKVGGRRIADSERLDRVAPAATLSFILNSEYVERIWSPVR